MRVGKVLLNEVFYKVNTLDIFTGAFIFLICPVIYHPKLCVLFYGTASRHGRDRLGADTFGLLDGGFVSGP